MELMVQQALLWAAWPAWIRPLWVVALGMAAVLAAGALLAGLLRLAAPRMAAVVEVTAKEGLLQPLFWVLLAIGAFFLILSPFISYNTLGEDIKMLKDGGLTSIMLLAVIVNLCVRTVGVLLINALLVVPAATAANLARNLRQVFWLTLLFCLIACICGQVIAWEVGTRTYDPVTRGRVSLGIPGTIIFVSVGFFVVSAVLGSLWRDRRPG